MHSQMKFFVSLLVICHIAGSLRAEKKTELTLNHPDHNGYQSAVVGSTKHKFGYELKENKQFHHTTTEKDGVRLGCYGYELNGKKYSTQYVADSKGYRIVSNQDLITVYPKFGGTRKASFVQDFDEDPALSSNIRYFFPDGCKGIDVLIDNSSRLRSMASSVNEVNVRLPVTLKPVNPHSGYHISPPNGYNPPGPPFIYPNVALNLIQTPAKPASQYMFGAKPPSDIAHTYLPPSTTTARPIAVTPAALPSRPAEDTRHPSGPANIYLPVKPSNAYVPTHSGKPTPVPVNDILPPKHPETDCESSQGNLVIPIPMKNQGGCCEQVAKLVIPIKSLNSQSISKLKATAPDEIDATQLIKNILENLL